MSEEKKQKLKEHQKIPRDQKFKIKNVDFFSFHSKKMKQEALYFGENGVIKNAFHKNKNPININLDVMWQ